MADVLKLSIARTADGSGLPLPSYSSRYHVGINLQAAISAALRIEPGDRVYVPTGFVFGISDGYCGMVTSIPMLAKDHGLVVSGAPQVVHPADRTPLFVLLQNISSRAFVLHRGDIVAQLIVTPIVQVMWNDLTDGQKLDKTTNASNLIIDSVRPEEPEEKKVSPRRVYKDPRHRFSEGEKKEE